MSVRRIFAVAVLSLAVNTGAVHAAPIVNGGFEAGLTGWTATPLSDVSVVGTVQGYAPAQGALQALISNSAGVDSADLASFLGLPVPTLLDSGGTAYEGSAIKRTLDVQAGDTLSFSWAFLTAEIEVSGFPPLPDFGFLLIDQQLSILATALDPGLQALSPDPGPPALLGGPYLFGTPRSTFTHTFASAGTHTIAFGVVDIDDYISDSALLIDAVDLQSVPEPTTMVLFGTGAAIAAVRRRRAQR